MKNQKHKILLVLALLGIVAMGWLLGRGVQEENQIKMVYIPKIIDNNNEFWTALIAGARMAAEEYHIDLTIIAPQREEDFEKQNALILEAIEQNPDVILVSPSHYTGTLEAVKEVRKRGIKLVFIDSEVKEPVWDSIVATDNFIAGTKMGNLAKSYIDDNTQIAVVGHVKTSSTAIERIRGLEYILGKRKSQIVETVFCDSTFEKAYSLTEELVKKYPDLDLVIGTNEYSAVGAANAIKDLGMAGKIKMVGFDNSIEEVQLLEEGVFVGIVVQKPFNMGYLGIEQAYKILKNEEFKVQLDSGSELITKENMYTEENQKLLFPFVGRQFREAQD